MRGRFDPDPNPGGRRFQVERTARRLGRHFGLGLARPASSPGAAVVEAATPDRPPWTGPFVQRALGSSVASLTLAIGSLGCRAPAAGGAGKDGIVVPPDWQPALELTARLFAGELESLDASQMELNLLSTQQAIVIDGRLFVVCERLWEYLDTAGRARLFGEQSEWLKRRPRMAHARNEYPEGSISPLSYNLAYTEVTRERLEELER